MAASRQQHALAVKNLEQTIALYESEPESKSPKQLKQMRALLEEMRSTPSGDLSADSQRALRQLFVWQLEQKREEYVARIEEMEPHTSTDQSVAKAQKALKNVLAVFDEARKAVSSESGVSSSQALKQVEAASERARTSLQDYEQVQPPADELAPPAKPSSPAASAPAPGAAEPEATPPPPEPAAAELPPAPASAPTGATASIPPMKPAVPAPSWATQAKKKKK